MTKNTIPTATISATGADSAVLSGLGAGMKYSVGGDVWIDVLSSADITLTGLAPCKIYVVRKGNGEDKLDSDAQVLTLTQNTFSKLSIVEPTTADEKGSIFTGTNHEYSLDGKSWISCTGALEGLDVGTYYVRVKANGTALASKTQTIIIHPFDFVRVEQIKINSSLNLYIGGSDTLDVGILPNNASDKRVIFTSDNEAVATVDQNGRVTAVSKGTATITVTLVDGEKTAVCVVSVLCGHTSLGEWQIDGDEHSRKCLVCGEDVDKGKHSFGAWEIILMPTDDDYGLRERVCECGHKEEQNFYFAGSDPGEKDTAVSPISSGCSSSIAAAGIIAIPLMLALAVRPRKED